MLTPAEAARLLERHGLSPSRALGQHFVVDPNTIRKIVALAAVGAGDHVVEVGPGLGSLTRPLVDTGARVTAIELDRHLLPALEETLAGAPVTVVQGDALRFDWSSVLDGPATLVANLPYNVATPLVADLLDGQPRIERMVVMVQREAADRLVAGVGDDAYGAVSVKVAYWARARFVARVPPTVFLPRPRVDSAVVEIERRAEPAVAADPRTLFALVRSGFATRRKMLRRSLRGLATEQQLVAAGIRPEARAEELTVDDWGRLAAEVRADG